MPQVQYPDCFFGDLIAQLVISNQPATHITRREVGEGGADTRLGQQHIRRSGQLLEDGRRSRWVQWFDKGMQSCEVAKCVTRPDCLHVGTGSGVLVLKLAAQALTWS